MKPQPPCTSFVRTPSAQIGLEAELLSRNFRLREFRSRDGTPLPAHLRGNLLRLVRNLQVLRDHLGRPVIVTSGYRSPAYNQQVGGARQSRHMTAEAADIRVRGLSPAQLYCTIEQLIATGRMQQGGLGIYVGHVHYDVRGFRARWAGRRVARPTCQRPSPPAPGPSPAPVPPPAPTPGAREWSLVPADERIRYVMDLLVRRYGYPENGAAGIVGNLWAESAVLPNRIEGSLPAAPMRARDFTGRIVDFTAAEVRDRDPAVRRGPRRPGVGLAQWTSPARRAGLFRHPYGGRVVGENVLFDMDAQVDYLVTELGHRYRGLDALLRRPGVAVHEAADEVVYRYEIPGRIIGPDRRKLPRHHPQVQQVFGERRRHADRALRTYRSHP